MRSHQTGLEFRNQSPLLGWEDAHADAAVASAQPDNRVLTRKLAFFSSD
jgi:hypothetical protein